MLVLFLQALSFMVPEHDILSKTLKDFEDGYAWNAIGSFGLILFGLVLIFPSSYRLLELTRSVLTTSSSIGFTTFYVSITTAILETPFGDLSPSLFDRSIAAFSLLTSSPALKDGDSHCRRAMSCPGQEL